MDVESHGGAGATGATGGNNLGLSGSTDAAELRVYKLLITSPSEYCSSPVSHL